MLASWSEVRARVPEYRGARHEEGLGSYRNGRVVGNQGTRQSVLLPRRRLGMAITEDTVDASLEGHGGNNVSTVAAVDWVAQINSIDLG